MKASRLFIGTLKEAPTDAEIVSHQLMMRAGMIRRVAGGIYSYPPIGLRSIRKVEAIVREEMNRAGALELLMPAVQPAELWQESARWEQYGPELLRIKDRHDRDFVIGPTHEEVVTDIERREIKSYKKLFDAYVRVFTRISLEFRAVAADNGSIGGSGSHESHVIADTGEDAIAYCPTSDFAANVEAAEALPLTAQRAAPAEEMKKTATPGKAKCEAVAELLNIPLERTIKSIVLATENEGAEPTIWLLMLRGDHDLNEIKASKQPVLSDFRMATEAEIIETFGTPPGYLGPINTKKPVKVIADRTVANMSDFVVGANEVDYHITGVNWGRDLPEPVVADIRNVQKGDPSPDGKGVIDICRGIEVGHVFQLGKKYSEAMNATFLDETGKPQRMEMGCYGIGVTRILGAAIEQNFDAKGIIWPEAIAPFEVVLCPMGYDRSDAVREQADKLYAALLAAGIDVVLDDRGERPGVMFADWELIGVPHRLVIGDRGLKEGKLEYQARRDTEATLLPVDDAANVVINKVRAALAS